MNTNNHIRLGTLGGTVVTLFANINAAELLKTVTMAAVGAAVSYLMSHGLKKVVDWFMKTSK